jgi:hypothetical protein
MDRIHEIILSITTCVGFTVLSVSLADDRAREETPHDDSDFAILAPGGSQVWRHAGSHLCASAKLYKFNLVSSVLVCVECVPG